MMLAFITKFNLVDALITNPTTNESKAVQAAFQFGSEFNLINGHPASIVEILDILITQLIVPTEFKYALIYYANDASEPLFPNVTLHDIKIARNTVSLKPVSQVNGYVVIETDAECEKHNPRLLAKVTNLRTDKIIYQRINSFYEVGEVGKYDAKVPSEFLEASLFVDNAYDVII